MAGVDNGQISTETLIVLIDRNRGRHESQPDEEAGNHAVPQYDLACTQMADQTGQNSGHDQLGDEAGNEKHR